MTAVPYGDKPVKLQVLRPQTNTQNRGTITSPTNIKEHTNGPHLTITRLLPNDNRYIEIGRAIAAARSVTPVWMLEVNSDNFRAPDERCGLYHDHRLREGFDLMRAGWAYPFRKKFVRRRRKSDPHRTVRQTGRQTDFLNPFERPQVYHLWNYSRDIFVWREIRPLHSVRRKLSGRFGSAKLAPRMASGHVCYRRGFARRIAAAAAACLCCLLLQQIRAAAAAAARHELLLLHEVCGCCCCCCCC